MLHKNLTAVAIVLLYLAVVTPSVAQFQLPANGPVTMESTDARDAFEQLGARAGVNVVFGLFRPTPTSFRVENKTVAETLDLLAKQTGLFWVPWNDRTIVVAQDDAVGRRDFDRQLLLTSVDAAGRTIVVRDTGAGTSAGKTVPGLDDVFLTQNGPRFRTPESVRSQLKIKVPPPFSLRVNEDSRTTYETLARMAGLNLILDSQFRSAMNALRLDNVGFFDALDLLSLQTRTFWQPINENTILVKEDNPTKRRDFEAHSVQAIYLPAGTSSQTLIDTADTVRNVLGLRAIFQNEAVNAIIVRDSPSNIILAERLITAMTPSGATLRTASAGGISDPFTELGLHFRAGEYQRTRLRIKSAGFVSIDVNDTSEAFRRLADMAGLNVVFGFGYRTAPVAFKLENVDIIDALDLLSLQTRNFWQPLDEQTILVMEDNPTIRRDYGAQIVKTIYLPTSTTPTELTGIHNLLRTTLGLRQVVQDDDSRAIVVKEVPQRIALAEKLVEQLSNSGTPITSALSTVPGLTEMTIRGTSLTARQELKFESTGPISSNMNQDARATFEALGKIGGINVTFDARFQPGPPNSFRVDGVDLLDALDYLSLQTRNFWKVVDNKTILVAPATGLVRRELDPLASKTFQLGSQVTAARTTNVVNMLRSLLGLGQIEMSSPGTITMFDTPQRIALTEQILASLEKSR